jgi:glycosyltransferase involved in cell wall biosynthesis
MITLIVPSYNNLRHMKNAYNSIRKFYPNVDLILMDDGSTDGTLDWLKSLVDKDPYLKIYESKERVGHTILYDVGIEMATTKVVGILHADMILGPGYIENTMKHLRPGRVVCATRVEPPLHPQGKEKIIKNFGLDFDSLDVEGFENFCIDAQKEFKDQTTAGMFAPWLIYKEDFEAIGGHDPLFAPFPLEDSDIFQRWLLAGYELVQSRDAFVYHLTCRGHRWTEQVGVDDDYYKKATEKATRNYLRKWGSWIKNDEYQHPIISPKYDIGIVLQGGLVPLLSVLEPWCSKIYVEDLYELVVPEYIKSEQLKTAYDISSRVVNLSHQKEVDSHDILLYITNTTFNQEDFQNLQRLTDIIKETDDTGVFELGNIKIVITDRNELQKDLIDLKPPPYHS